MLASSIFSDHVVSGAVLLPGVGYVEMAFVFNGFEHTAATSTVRFVRPCVLSEREVKARRGLTLQYTRHRKGLFEIASSLVAPQKGGASKS